MIIPTGYLCINFFLVGFKCNVCKKTFIHLNKLKIHQVRHENEKTYNCGYDNCFRSYLYKRNLIYHINKCHKKIELHRLGCTEPNCQMSFTRMVINLILVVYIVAMLTKIFCTAKSSKPY